MKPVYFAPLEGIGNHIYRGVFARHYSGVDRFYTPFIDINSDGGMKNRSKNDILPENNEGICLIPQVLTKNADALGEASRYIAGLGYTEINLNMGCPSATVTKKGKGSGMLADTDSLDRFLEKAFTVSCTKLSVKMRIGISNETEWEGLMEVLNRYPLSELIVHPRLMTQVYEGSIHEDIFRKIYEVSKAPVCLNPGIRSADDFLRFERSYPGLTGLMIGRGLVANPALAEEIRSVQGILPSGTVTSSDCVGVREQSRLFQGISSSGTVTSSDCVGVREQSRDFRNQLTGNVPPVRKRFRAFHDDLLEAYRGVLFGETPVLHKMKELWDFWELEIPLEPKLKKALSKASSVSEYQTVIRQILS